MDIKVKQRLIGALVLGAIAIIFLPMLVTGPEAERPADAADVPIDAPEAPEAGFITREIALQPAAAAGADTDANANAAVSPPSSNDPGALATVDASAGAAPRVDALPNDAAVAVDAATGEPVTAAPATVPTPVATVPAAAEPVPAATTPATTPVPATAATSSSSVIADGDYAVNVGTFSNRASADGLMAKLQAAGLPAYEESISVNGNAATRVRVGPYSDRAGAESARLRANAATGGSTVVVAAGGERAVRTVSTSAPTQTRTTPVPVPAAANVGFAVQLGAFASEAEANALIGRARGAGFVAFSQSVPTANGTLWRVRLGPEVDRSAADRLQADANAKLGIRGNVVPHP